MHAATLRLKTGAHIAISADLVNVTYAWIRHLASKATDGSTKTERASIVASRVARALDIATAPMYMTAIIAPYRPFHVEVAETLTSYAEQFVLAHELAHLYLINDRHLRANPPTEDWATLTRSQRICTRELMADAIGFDMLIEHTRQLAAEHHAPDDPAIKHAATGSVLALAAIDLLERYDTRYADPQYPSGAIRRLQLRAAIAGLGSAVTDYGRAWETVADRLARDALLVAQRRRTVAGNAVACLLAGEEGAWREADWHVDQVDFARERVRYARGKVGGSRTTRTREHVSSSPPNELTAEPNDPGVDVRIRLTWHRAGPVTPDRGKLVFPTLPRSPGIYRLTFSGLAGQPRVYIGESDDLRRRTANYRNPGPTQQTSQRIHQELINHLTAGGTVTVSVATSAVIDADGETEQLPLARKTARVLAEHAALGLAYLNGEAAIVNRDRGAE